MSERPTPSPVQIVTDSTSDIPPELLGGLPLTVVPLTVEINGRSYQDGLDLSRDEFLEQLRAGAFPKTSQPSIGAFREVYRELLDQGYSVVSVHIASQLSGTYNAARSAGESLDGKRIRLVDSGTVSMALGWLAIEAAQLAREGRDLEQIEQYLLARREDQRVWAMLDTLEYLRRGGRIGRTATFLGSALQIKPVVAVRHGEVEPLERVRTTRRAIDRVVALAEEEMPLDRIAVLHLGAPEAAAAMVERLQRLQPEAEIVASMIGTVIGTYGGPGLAGIAALARRQTPAT